MSSKAWGYLEYNGPSTWGMFYSIANEGKRQSPINLCTKSFIKVNEKDFKPLVYEYPSNIMGLEIMNTGQGWRVDIPPNIAERTILKYGPLEHCYKLEQFHAHWGKNCSTGSEHTINGKSYAAEIHFVHWNTDLFCSFNEAADRDKGLAVVGVFLDASDQIHKELDKITNVTNLIKYKDNKVIIKEKINIDAFLPKKSSYFTYKGSLTTPPLYESVTWIVFEAPIKVSKEQIDRFRQLTSNSYSEVSNNELSNILENFRPTQPLWGREVRYFE